MNFREHVKSIEPDALFLTEEKYDAAIAGMVESWDMSGQRLTRVCYDLAKLTTIIADESEDGEYYERVEAAIEYIEYNILNAFVGPYTPCFITTTTVLKADMMEMS